MDRKRIVNLILFCMFLFLTLGLLNLQLLRGKKNRELSDKNCIRLLPQYGGRGKILDSDGNIIVDNKLSYDVLMAPQKEGVMDREQIFQSVAKILDTSVNNLKNTYLNNFLGPSLPVAIAKNIGRIKAIALEEMKLELPGIMIQPNPVREYPFGKIACHVVGYCAEIDRWRLTKLEDYGYKTKDIVGFGGVEEKYDYYLRQEEGGESFEVDHRGRFRRILGFRSAQQGKNIQLTLNIKVQKLAEVSLAGRKGAVVVMDPESGAIIAMASGPGFAPAVFVEKNNSAISSLFNSADAPLLNRAISGAYPAGSVFKPVVAMAGLETKKINMSTTFTCTGSTLVGRQNFKCWSTHGEQNLTGGLAHSCNVFFYKSGLLIGAQNIHDYALKFGLSRSTGFELPYEANGFIPSPLWRKINKFKNWYDGDTANLAIGQGDCLVTPLQMARLMAVYANDGTLVTPYIVKAVDDKDISFYQKKCVRLGFRQSDLDHIKEGLREVISLSNGTGNVLSGLPVEVAGKTGTAQAPPKLAHAWFAGYFPAKHPKFVICVFLEHGGPGYYSCVVAKQIIEGMNKEGLI